MKQYQTPIVEVLELTADTSIAGAIYSEPIVEDLEESLST